MKRGEAVVAFCVLSFYALIEFIWISTMRPFYDRSFDAIQPLLAGKRYKVLPAVLCYIILFLVVYVFIIRARASIIEAVAFALAVYGIYNLTNMATLQGYSWVVAVVDVAWGTFAMVAVSLCSTYCRRILNVP